MTIRIITLILLLCASLEADSIAYSAYSTANGYLTPADPAYSNGALVVQQFDPSLGTLNNVTITWAANEGGRFFYASGDYSSAPFQLADWVETGTASAGGGNASIPDYETSTNTVDTMLKSVLYDYPVCCYETFGFNFSGTVAATDNSFYVGTSFVGVPVAVSFSMQSYGELYSDSSLVTDSSVDFSGEVTYDYTPVPEPRSLLLICGLLGTVVAARIIEGVFCKLNSRSPSASS